MNQTQQNIIYILKEKDKYQSVSNIAAKLKRNPVDIEKHLDLMNDSGLVELQRSASNNKIRRAKLLELGKDMFYSDNKIKNRAEIEHDIAELKELVHTLELAVKALENNKMSDGKERKTIMERLDTMQGVGNGVPTLINSIIELIK